MTASQQTTKKKNEGQLEFMAHAIIYMHLYPMLEVHRFV